MIKVKCGAIVREISPGALKWFKEAGWKVVSTEKENKKDKTNSEETTAT